MVRVVPNIGPSVLEVPFILTKTSTSILTANGRRLFRRNGSEVPKLAKQGVEVIILILDSGCLGSTEIGVELWLCLLVQSRSKW
jgi:hypothetical protein